MFRKKLLLVTVLGTSIANMLVAAPALRAEQKAQPATTTPAPAAAPSESDKRYLEAIGWKMGTQSLEAARDTLGLSDAEKKIIIQGMKSGIEGKPSPIDFKAENDKIVGYRDS